MPGQAMSGVALSDDIATEYNCMKLGQKPYRYMQMKISDDNKEIVIEERADKSKTYQDFVSQLPPDDCRYAIVDYKFQGQETGPKDILLFFVWCPDTAPVKKKMLYASSKDALKSACKGIQAEIQANDFDEVSEEAVIDKCKGKK